MKNTITGVIIGGCLVVTILSVWYAFSLNSRVNTLENIVGQVVTLINNASKNQAPAK